VKIAFIEEAHRKICVPIRNPQLDSTFAFSKFKTEKTKINIEPRKFEALFYNRGE
jgi:hypothetical protein